jgi:hypothetical protein
VHTFLAVFTGTPESMARRSALPEHERKTRQAEGLIAWAARADCNKSAIVDHKVQPTGFSRWLLSTLPRTAWMQAVAEELFSPDFRGI